MTNDDWGTVIGLLGLIGAAFTWLQNWQISRFRSSLKGDLELLKELKDARELGIEEHDARAIRHCVLSSIKRTYNPLLTKLPLVFEIIIAFIFGSGIFIAIKFPPASLNSQLRAALILAFIAGCVMSFISAVERVRAKGILSEMDAKSAVTSSEKSYENAHS